MNRIQERLTPQEYEMFVERFKANRDDSIESHIEEHKDMGFGSIIRSAFVWDDQEVSMWSEISYRTGPPTQPDLSNYTTIQLLEEVLSRLKQ